MKNYLQKSLSIVLVLTLVLGLFSGLSFQSAASVPSSGKCGEHVTYTFDSATGLLTISGGGAMNNYYYSSNSPFYNQTGIKTVVIKSGVTSIGYNAFRGCNNLTSVTIPNSVTNIDDFAFYNCSGLTGVTIPNSVTSIGIYAFYGCSSLTSITIPNSVTSIERSAFSGCSRLTNITIPDSVTSIEYSAFSGCSSLTSVTIPNSVTSIGSYVFYGCSGLTSITIPEAVTSIGRDAFSGCSSLTNVTIPNSVTSIGDDAFYDCSGLTGITIPNSVTSIGGSAFYGCSGLTGITIPNSVTSIGGSAFYGCSGLTSVTIPNSVTSIGDSAFYCCSRLEKVNISSIEAWCKIRFSNSYSNPLYYAHNLYLNDKLVTDIVIQDSVTSIGDYAFSGCSGLTSVTIGNSVTSIGSGAFSGCSSLTSITIPNSVTSISSSAFSGCSGLTSVTIGNSVTSIGSGAFSGCSSLTSITIPNSVTSIGSYAFYGCSGLTSVTIPDSVTSIGDYAFSYCSSLTSVTIPDSVTSIGDDAFCGCSWLTSVTIPDSITSIGIYAFRGCNSLTSITIPNSVTSIGSYVFYGCSGLTSVTIPDSVTSIGVDAFWGCSGLKKVNISSIEAWCKIRFGGSYSNPLYYAHNLYLNDKLVTDIVIPDSVTSIGSGAFYGCGGLTSITIPDSVTSIGDSAFYGCYDLTDVFYTGTKNQWNAIDIGEYNDCLTRANIIFNYVEHEHAFDEGIVTEAPDCYNTGTKTYTCSVCGYKTYETLAALGHKFAAGEPYCQNSCGAVNPDYVPPHTHNYTSAITTAPACTQAGVKTFTCTCGETYTELVAALGHAFGAWQQTKAPTCTAKGEETRVCTRDISHKEVRDISALGHNSDVEKTVTSGATQLGYSEHRCSRCDELQNVDSYTEPTGKLTLKHSARTANAIKVQWNKVKTATGYQVQISTKDGKKWSTYATLKAGVTNYTFKKLAAGNNYKFRVRFYIKAADGKNYYSPWSATLNSPTLPTGTTLTKLSPSSKAFTAQWKANKTVTGYQIQYSTNSKFTGAKTVTVKSNKTLKTTVKKLSAKKVYYVRIRTYKTISRVNYFSTWSKAVKVKTK